MKTLAIVPARGGSKRLKNKNIKFFFGKPILQRTFNIIKKSGLFDKIILTTDSVKIRNIGKKIGFDLILNRDKKLANNKATTLSVIKDTISKHNNKEFKFVCCIYPCNPLLQTSDLKKTFNKIKKIKKKFIFPVCEYPHPLERAFYLAGKKKNINFINKENANKNTQNFKKKYHDAGQFYWGKRLTWLNSRSIHNNAVGYEIPKFRAVDIDDYSDWKKAEFIFLGMKKK
tara:strand:+ start:7269 stop:7955 length:687 start_codon:yes stop_codon:yes gene_type:complete